MIPQAIPDLEDSGKTGYHISNRGFVGTRCTKCGATQLDAVLTCQPCGSSQIDQTTFGDSGKLYSFTTVHVSSYSSNPYTLAYVDLDDGPRVLGEILSSEVGVECDVRVIAVPSELAIDTWGFQIVRGDSK